MLERAGARFWISIVAAVLIFPTAVVLLLAAWAIHVQIALPTFTESSPVRLAAAPAVAPMQEKVAAAVPPQHATVTEPLAPPPQAPEPSSSMPTPAEISPTDADRAENVSPSASPTAPERPSGPVSPMPAQVEAAAPPPPATAATEPVVPEPDAKAREFASASSLFATLAAVPPILGRTSPAYADPTQDTFSSASPMTTTKPALSELSEPISSPVPLPKPKPHATVALASRPVPLPRPRPELTR
jgi:hypothetical protein